jgi:hypothetical protein
LGGTRKWGRRRFLEASGLTAGVLAWPRSSPVGPRTRAASGRAGGRDPAARAERAQRIRVEAARRERERRLAAAVTNGDEERYPDRIASFTKGLPHDERGHVDGAAYDALLRALASGRAADFETVPAGGGLKLVNPRAGLAFALEGPDGPAVAMPAPPAFASAEMAAEAGELYWQALLRDVPFAEYETTALAAQAADDLTRLSGLRAPKVEGRVTPQTLFRGDSPGEQVGPYVSQFLWKEAPYGAVRLVQQVRTGTPGIDYLATWEDWLAVQNGQPAPARHPAAYRYVRSGRDLGAYVLLDFSYQAFLTACLILFGMQGTTDAQRPYKGAPWDAGNPYRGSRRETGFVTFGVVHALDLVARAALAPLRAGWYQKWMVHRRLRPEEFGGRVHRVRAGLQRYPVHEDLLGSRALDLVFEKNGTWLLPQGNPEGCPLHPAYPAGHALIAGACTTVLKAFFDETFPVDDPVLVSADGLSVKPYVGPTLTVGGELNKLASNVAFGRNMLGIHWRSDGSEGLRMGEEVALALLAEMRACFAEDFGGFSLTRFDGTTATA